MKLPPDFQGTSPGKVCKLQKSLYGLKQAPRCWLAKLSSALTKYGFQQSHADCSFFSLHRVNVRMHVLVYMNDLIILGNDSVAVQQFKTYLSRSFFI